MFFFRKIWKEGERLALPYLLFAQKEKKRSLLSFPLIPFRLGGVSFFMAFSHWG
jgi:hypothetical protein